MEGALCNGGLPMFLRRVTAHSLAMDHASCITIKSVIWRVQGSEHAVALIHLSTYCDIFPETEKKIVRKKR